jgi:all-trans-retinol 13,14-reductase
MHLCHEPQPRYAQTGVILSYMHMRDVERWRGTLVGHRGADYERFKAEKTERLLDVVERQFPGLRGQIEHVYSSTPLTYLDYTGTEDGSMYGIAKDVSLGAACRVPHRTRIPNLLLTGQNINSHGMLGVIVGAIVSTSEMVRPEEIYRQIKETGI